MSAEGKTEEITGDRLSKENKMACLTL